MTTLWRVVDARFADDPLSTEGAYRFPARWHRAGTRVLYCAETESLARTERFVHLVQETDMAFVLLELGVPDGARIETVKKLPVDLAGWDDITGSVARTAGAWWAEHTKALGLSVPSVLSGSERDVLLRAASPDFAKIRVVGRTAFRFDKRLFNARPVQPPSSARRRLRDALRTSVIPGLPNGEPGIQRFAFRKPKAGFRVPSPMKPAMAPE